jgi:hypothetical protein
MAGRQSPRRHHQDSKLNRIDSIGDLFPPADSAFEQVAVPFDDDVGRVTGELLAELGGFGLTVGAGFERNPPTLRSSIASQNHCHFLEQLIVLRERWGCLELLRFVKVSCVWVPGEWRPETSPVRIGLLLPRTPTRSRERETRRNGRRTLPVVRKDSYAQEAHSNAN